ncbi:PE family protein, partial [Mycobacterium helveticum]
MAYLSVSPDIVYAVAANVESIGTSLASGHVAAAAFTTGVTSAAADEVSTAVAALFSQFAQDYQKLAAESAAFQDRFVLALTNAGHSYAAAEAGNTSALQILEQDVLGLINAPTRLLLGRPLIGNGTNGAPGTGQAGGPGGILFGNGGNGGSGVS